MFGFKGREKKEDTLIDEELARPERAAELRRAELQRIKEERAALKEIRDVKQARADLKRERFQTKYSGVIKAAERVKGAASRVGSVASKIGDSIKVKNPPIRGAVRNERPAWLSEEPRGSAGLFGNSRVPPGLKSQIDKEQKRRRLFDL